MLPTLGMQNTENLQQRSEEWHKARRGKLTASNLGNLLGVCKFVSRKEAWRRAMGKAEFKGNAATQWGTANEVNGITAYAAKTGNAVLSTGLHIHPTYKWLCGSPDGFVGDEGMIEIKCPYYSKKDGSSRLHESVPPYYWLQMNALLEICNRKWCDYTCWAPEGFVSYRVYRDPDTFEYLLSYYSQIYAMMQLGGEDPPPLSPRDKEQISNRIEEAMKRGVDLLYWKFNADSFPPPRDASSDSTEDADSSPPSKRQRVLGPAEEGDTSQLNEAGPSETVCVECDPSAEEPCPKVLQEIHNTQVQVQAVSC